MVAVIGMPSFAGRKRATGIIVGSIDAASLPTAEGVVNREPESEKVLPTRSGPRTLVASMLGRRAAGGAPSHSSSRAWPLGPDDRMRESPEVVLAGCGIPPGKPNSIE